MKTASSWTFGRHGSVTVPHPMHPASRCWWMFGWSWSISWKSATMLDVFLSQKVASLRWHAKRLLNYLVLSMKRHVFLIFIQSNSEANSILVSRCIKHLASVFCTCEFTHICIKSDHHLPVWDASIYQGSVMFWIHGGSYVTGGTKDMFNGTQLAKEFGVSRLESLGAHVCWWKTFVGDCCAVCGLLQSSKMFVICRNMDFDGFWRRLHSSRFLYVSLKLQGDFRKE